MAVIETQIRAINKSEKEFKQLHRDLKKTRTEGKKAATVWDRFGAAGKGAAGDVSKAMEGASGKAGFFGSAISRLGPIGIAAGAGLGAVTAALTAGTMSMAEWEQRLGRTEALLKATGYAAGLTAGELDKLARDRDLATLGDRNEIMDAINVMQTFKSVAGDTFRESITLAQDMSVVTGQSLTSATTMLGKALEDPIKGLNSMRRVGVSFTETEEQVIRAMTEANDVAGAQAKIMEVLRGQFEGAAEGEAKGLLGVLDTLSYEWRDLMEAMSNTDLASEAVSGLTDLVKSLSYSVKDLSDNFSLDEQASQIESAIASQKRAITTMREEAAELPLLDAWIGKSAHLDAAQEKLTELENKLHRIKALQEGKDIKDTFVIHDKGKEAATFRANDYAVLDQARKDKEAEAARKQKEKDKEQEEKKAQVEKERLAKEAVRRLESEQKAREKRLADYRLKLDEARLGEEYVKRQKIENEYQEMLKDGIGRSEADFWKGKELDGLTKEVKGNVSQWEEAFGSFGNEAKSTWDQIGGQMMSVFSTGDKALDNFISKMLEVAAIEMFGQNGGTSTSGGGSWGAVGSIVGSFFSSVHHDGGVVGGPSPTRMVPADLFKNAPRFHTGGIIGPGERPIIAKNGEVILNEAQQGNLAGKLGGSTFVFNADFSLPTPSGDQGKDSAYMADMAKSVQKQFDVWFDEKLRNSSRVGGLLNKGPVI